MIKTQVTGNRGKTADVSDNQELFVTQRFSRSFKATLNVDDQGFTVVGPRANEKFIVTSLIVNTNRDIGVNGALIEIYEASSENSATIDSGNISFDLIKNQTVIAPQLLIETLEGKFLNAKASDSIVNVTILGYFVKVN